ncbi:Unknown protein [Striga hermonthica]|uniref:Reverse transcriptase domain-containing protein n=1 Tax=Striga hermonthica TaxID=68872 RepID=A0A9N7RK51_STRHE|nr:Unknown protein [Striga hermonthica]
MQLQFNDTISEEFTLSRGVRQGDTISSYLFVLAMERLAHLIQHRVQQGAWRPISVGLGEVTIPYLMFADDLLLFMEASTDQVDVLNEVLSILSHNSGFESKFIWGSSQSVRKVHLVNWSSLCTPKEKGGLGLKNQRRMNMALLMKLGWGLLSKLEALWVRVLCAKYKLHPNTMSDGYHFPSGSVILRAIARVCPHVVKGTRWSIGDGSRILFWWDNWLNFSEDLITRA